MKFLDRFELPRADPGTKEFFLLDSPWPSALICMGYLLFVLKLGPIFMKNHKPYNIKTIMLIYNAIQVLYNGLMFSYGIYRFFISPVYDMRCMETLSLDHPLKPEEHLISYVFLLNKLLDMLDTLFFVLRKSYKQITILHVFHHALMFSGMYWVVRMYGTGAQYSMMGFFNSFVHTVMYSYYFISALYPQLKGSLWWKKYITRLQLAQFVLLFFQPIHVLIFNPTCGFPFIMHLMQLATALLFTLMFSNFYYHAYINPKPLKMQ